MSKHPITPPPELIRKWNETHADQTIRLTWGEFKALKKLIKELDK